MDKVEGKKVIMNKEEEELFELIKKANAKPILSEVAERVRLELGAFCAKPLLAEMLLMLKRREETIHIADMGSQGYIINQPLKYTP